MNKSLIKSLIPPSLVTFRLPDSVKTLLLTFDDGPFPEYTPAILDLLDMYNARAIFFMPGNRVEQNADIVKEIIRRGHMVGNHSYSHPTSALSLSQWVEELRRCQQMIFDVTSFYPTYFRPVRGRITPSILLAARRNNLRVMHWSFDIGDYSYMSGASVGEIAENFTMRIRQRDIVLAHDSHEVTPDILKLVLPQLTDQGYDLAKGISLLNARADFRRI